MAKKAYDPTCPGCVASSSGMCARHKREYAEQKAWERQLQAKADCEAELRRLGLADAQLRIEALNFVYKMPESTLWVVPHGECDCEYCRREGAHPMGGLYWTHLLSCR